MYDATELFRMLPAQKKVSVIKLGFYLVSFSTGTRAIRPFAVLRV